MNTRSSHPSLHLPSLSSPLPPSSPVDFNDLFSHLNTLLLSSNRPTFSHGSSPTLHHLYSLLPTNPRRPIKQKGRRKPGLVFSSTMVSSVAQGSLLSSDFPEPTSFNLAFCSTTISSSDAQRSLFSADSAVPSSPLGLTRQRAGAAEARALMKTMPAFERAVVGAGAGGIAGAFTYFCLLPIDAVKTKLQTKGAAAIYSSAMDAAGHIFKSSGILGFYRGVSAVIVGSAFSSAIYFGTCELGKSLLGKFPSYPPVLIPPTAGAMGNIVSSAIMVPKELITQRMQAGAAGRSWEVLLRILEKDGILGLYAGYSATLLRNLPAGILSYSSFEYLKGFVLRSTGQSFLEPAQSVCCGALAGAISASLTTPLDVVKTRLMTQLHGEAGNKISETVRQILMEEGWLGLTRGIGPRVLHSACFSALGYCAFETARLYLLHCYVHRREKKVHEASA